MTSILVIEDEDPIREEVVDWLRFEGYEVIEANNGRSGLDLARQYKPNLIISDIKMPELDGYAILLEMRSDPMLNHIPFIFLTASAARESFRKGMDLGADDYLTKPFTHEEVISAVRSRLDKHQQTQRYLQEQVNLLEESLEEERHKRLLKAQLVAMFSHDFRNPLTVIQSSAYLLRYYAHSLKPGQSQAKLDQIMLSTQQLTQMLDDMMLAARIESGHFEYMAELLDLNSMTQSLVKEFSESQGVGHTLLFESTLEEDVWLDPKLMRQIISNLLSNAIKYSPPGSIILTYLQEEDESVKLTVRDNGIGIPEEDLPQLFKPFHRSDNARRIQGTGIGLAIVQQAVELSGGSIEVQSKVNAGTTFIVRLPLRK